MNRALKKNAYLLAIHMLLVYLFIFFPLEYAYIKIKELLITFFLSTVFDFTHEFVQIFQKHSEMFLQITFFYF